MQKTSIDTEGAAVAQASSVILKDEGFVHPTALVESREIGPGTRIWAFAHVLEGAVIGSNCNVGDHCFIERGARIGNDVVVKNGVAVWDGVTIEDRAFIGPHVNFTNDRVPRAKVFRDTYDGTVVREGASLGANVTLVAPVAVGRFAIVGAGAVVTHDIPDYAIVKGNPARVTGFACQCGGRLPFGGEADSTDVCSCGLVYEYHSGEVRQVRRQRQSGQHAAGHTDKISSVPFVDLRAQHDEIRPAVDAAIKQIIDNSSFVGGTFVENFERDFADFCGTRHAIACASGTDALKLALIAAGVGPGDEVITVPHTFIATVEAITGAGAHPVFVDIDRSTYNLCPDILADFLSTSCQRNANGNLINKKTGRRLRALLPVHLYGLPADMARLLPIAQQFGLRVIEDACQAHGAECRIAGVVKRAGSLASVAAFSFYPGKNLGAMGEGGAVTTDSESMAREMRISRDHGQSERYIHVSAAGWNGRLDTLQCAVLGLKLPKLEQWNRCRNRAAQWYRERLGNEERIVLPVVPEGRTHVYHLFVVSVPDRERVWREMSAHGVGVGLHYPVPLHLQEAYRDLGWQRGSFPVSEAAASSILSLPMFPHITEAQVDYVCRTLRNILG
jgi:dTDP-4-amino-4,6-dideoxygalactose transaminase/acetyltransferase-like isoleucine patch superfamily enzyme